MQTLTGAATCNTAAYERANELTKYRFRVPLHGAVRACVHVTI
jgi:hypothetical protein